MIFYKNFLNSIMPLTYAISFILCSNAAIAADPLSKSESPTSAPGRGIIASVSNHYKTMPSFYDFDNIPAEHITNTIDRRFIMGTQSMLTRWDLKAGTTLPLHFHYNEQITRVKKGTLEIYSQGKKYVMTAGQVMVFPANVPHEFVALKDTTIIEQHTPPRQDFINGDFEKAVGNISNK